jgi:hypothetical protein
MKYLLSIVLLLLTNLLSFAQKNKYIISDDLMYYHPRSINLAKYAIKATVKEKIAYLKKIQGIDSLKLLFQNDSIFGYGVDFTSDPEIAALYGQAEDEEEKEEIKPTYIDVKNHIHLIDLDFDGKYEIIYRLRDEDFDAYWWCPMLIWSQKADGKYYFQKNLEGDYIQEFIPKPKEKTTHITIRHIGCCNTKIEYLEGYRFYNQDKVVAIHKYTGFSVFFDTEENVNSIFPQKNTLSKLIYTKKDTVILFHSPKIATNFCQTIKKAKMTILAEHIDKEKIKWYFVYVHENSSVEATTLTEGGSVFLPRNYNSEGMRGNLYAWILAKDVK